MAAEERIDSFIDLSSIKKEYDIFLSYLHEMQRTVETINKLKISLDGSTKGKDIAATLNEATTASHTFEQQSKAMQSEFSKMLNTSKLSANELVIAQRQLNLEITKSKEATRLKAIADKEAAAAAKQAAKEAQEAGMERSRLAQEAQKDAEKLRQIEQARNEQEEKRLASSSYNDKSTGNKTTAAATGPAFVPSTQLETQVQLLQKTESLLAANQLQQKNLKKELDSGAISQGEYNKQINRAIQLETQYKQVISTTGASVKNLTREQEAIKGSLEQRRAALIRLNREYDNLGPQGRATAAGQRMQRVIAGLTTQVQNLEIATGRSQRNVGNYGSALQANASKAFAALRNIANIIPGLGLAGLIGILVDPIISFTKKLFESKSAIQQNRDVLNDAKGAYTAAAVEVSELKNNIQLAKEGFMDKDKVIKQYNESIGKTTGQVTTLDQAEKAITKNGDAYIKFTLLKAAAHAALTKAAEKTLEAETKAAEPVRDESGFGDQIAALFQGGGDLSGTRASDQAYEKALGKRKDARVKALTKESSEFEAIAKKFTDRAKEIADKLKFSYDQGNGDAGPDTTKIKAINKKFLDDELKDQVEALKAISNNDTFYFTDRIQKRKAAYDIERKLIEEQRNHEIKTAQAALSSVIGDPKSSKNARINAENEYANTVEEIAYNSGRKLKKIDTELNYDLLKIKNLYANAQREQLTKIFADEEKLLSEQDKARKDAEAKKYTDIDGELSKRTNYLSIGKDIEIKALEERRQAMILDHSYGKEEQERYEKDLLKIENDYNRFILLAEADAASKKLALLKASGLDVTEQEAKIAAIRAKIAKSGTTETLEIVKEQQEEIVALFSKIAEVYNDVSDVLSKAADIGFTKQKNDLQDLIDLGEKKRQKDIEAIEATAASEQEKADKIATLNARVDAQKQQLELRQRQVDQKKAQFDKALAIGQIITNTALAVTKLLATPPLAILAAALGAAQLAIAIAQPIPKYKHGTKGKEHPGGLAILGDGGKKEYVQLPDGAGFVSHDRPTLYDLPKGAHVHPDAERLQDVMRYASFKAVPKLIPEKTKDSKQLDDIKKTLNGVISAIENKPSAKITNTYRGVEVSFETAHRQWQWQTKWTQSK